MSLLEIGKFENIGDEFTMQLAQITNVTSFASFSDVIFNDTGSRFFKKEFRYKKNSDPVTPWAVITNPLLAALISIPSDTWLFEIRYTRDGADTVDVLTWQCFKLEAVKVDACILLKINKTQWSITYGGDDKYLQIVDVVSRFNDTQTIFPGLYLFVVNDVSIVDKDLQIIKRTGATCADDLNDILRSEWGDILSQDLLKIKVSLFSGVRT